MLFKEKNSQINLGIDCGGGDYAPNSCVLGACLASKISGKEIFFHFFGNEEKISEIIDKNKIHSKYKIHHCESFIPSDAKPSSVLRGINREFKDCSLLKAIKAQKEGWVDGVLSAGNTGAIMVLGRFVLGMLSGIDRPAIISCIPNKFGKSFAMLDLGANIGCTTDDLVQFALMGSAFASALNLCENPGIENGAATTKQIPRLALLNIGEEEIKGNDAIKGAYKILKKYSSESGSEDLIFDFIGYCEPNNIFSGKADVIVCDGFAGNVALKTSEGTASIIKKFLHDVFKSSWITKLGYLLIARKLKKTMQLIDPKTHNCGMFVGLSGVLTKAHGNSDENAFKNSILLTSRLIKNKINDQIITQIQENNMFFENID
jgi:glycerol-3-phosphate acyltransferase PlsX